MTKRMAQDKRTDAAVQAAERALALGDPLDAPTAPTLEELLGPSTLQLVTRFERWLGSSLKPWTDAPIPPAEFLTVRVLLRACASGMDGSADDSPIWRHTFGSDCHSAQHWVRSIWQSVLAHKCPAPAEHAAFVDALAQRVAAVFTAARELQADRLKKREAAHGPAPRAQAAAALLEAAGPFTTALDQYAATAWRDVSNVVVDMRDQLARLTRIARSNLA